MSSFHAKVPIRLIHPHPDVPNPRGPVGDTTDLQESIKRLGLIEPIPVFSSDVLGEDGEDVLWRIGGNRRLTACSRLGWEDIDVAIHENLSRRDILLITAGDNLHSPIPELVLNEDMEVVGGQAWLALELKAEGEKNNSIAPHLGVRPDIVGAYLAIPNESEEMRTAIASGRIAMTVYSLIRKKPEAMKAYLLSKAGTITADMVRATIRDWEAIQVRLNGQDGDEAGDGATESEALPERECTRYTETEKLQKALNWLRQVNSAQIVERDSGILAEIGQAYEFIMEAI